MSDKNAYLAPVDGLFQTRHHSICLVSDRPKDRQPFVFLELLPQNFTFFPDGIPIGGQRSVLSQDGCRCFAA